MGRVWGEETPTSTTGLAANAAAGGGSGEGQINDRTGDRLGRFKVFSGKGRAAMWTVPVCVYVDLCNGCLPDSQPAVLTGVTVGLGKKKGQVMSIRGTIAA